MGKRKLYVINESAVGYSLFQISEAEEVAVKEADKTFAEFDRFSKTCKWVGILPFASQEQALEEMQAVAKATCTDSLGNWLKTTLPAGKKAKFEIGVADPLFGSSITKQTSLPCRVDDLVRAILRALRRHFSHFVEKNTGFEASDLSKASVGLGHEYSRAKVEFDKKADDTHIVHAISLLEDLNKTLNGMCQRVKEWYGLHFPELDNVLDDQVTYCRVVNIIGNRLEMNAAKEEALADLLPDESKVKEILGYLSMSMGSAFSEADSVMVHDLNQRCIDMANERDLLQEYLDARMNGLAPNLTEIIGSTVGAKLIAHTGSLVKLAKCPASTIQVLGAEKALFRALKSRSGKTPKYGLIFGSTWISRAKDKDKGRMSRVLSNKLAMASRIDCFSKPGFATNVYGTKLREQLEERLNYWATGKVPRTNQEVMEEAFDEVEVDAVSAPKETKTEETAEPKKKKKKKKKKSVPGAVGEPKKKKKKRKKSAEQTEQPTPADPKKKKKKRKAEEAQLASPPAKKVKAKKKKKKKEKA